MESIVEQTYKIENCTAELNKICVDCNQRLDDFYAKYSRIVNQEQPSTDKVKDTDSNDDSLLTEMSSIRNSFSDLRNRLGRLVDEGINI